MIDNINNVADTNVKMIPLELYDLFECDLLLNVLMDNGIRAIAEEYSDKAFGGAANEPAVWGRIYVDESDYTAVKRFLEEIRLNKVSVDFDETVDESALEAMDGDGM